MKILIIGGNRFFGKKLAGLLINQGHELTLLNRGNLDDGFDDKVLRLKCDRTNEQDLKNAIFGKQWDVVYDQVCFDYRTAKMATEIFNGKTSYYIFTSSQSVYPAGQNIYEDEFSTENYKLENEVSGFENYAEAKRQAEYGLWKHSDFLLCRVRLPIVIGNDDYTNRFNFHVERIKNEQPIYFPNINAKMSFITSDFAAQALASFSEKKIEGAINVASPLPISLNRFVGILEDRIGKKAILSSHPHVDQNSPYGAEEDWFMNCDKLKNSGLVGPSIEKWLPQLLL
ncbi:MAG: NAD-dependent epimerase/dehydratase family protein [Bdellovibrionales bacterium]|nr:NAD-dependent epimerase/dehydratase family protein [Bdellovibrionales bacterium]